MVKEVTIFKGVRVTAPTNWSKMSKEQKARFIATAQQQYKADLEAEEQRRAEEEARRQAEVEDESAALLAAAKSAEFPKDDDGDEEMKDLSHQTGETTSTPPHTARTGVSSDMSGQLETEGGTEGGTTENESQGSVDSPQIENMDETENENMEIDANQNAASQPQGTGTPSQPPQPPPTTQTPQAPPPPPPAITTTAGPYLGAPGPSSRPDEVIGPDPSIPPKFQFHFVSDGSTFPRRPQTAGSQSGRKRPNTSADNESGRDPKRPKFSKSFTITPMPEFTHPTQPAPRGKGESFWMDDLLPDGGPGRGFLDNKRTASLLGERNRLADGFVCHEIFRRNIWITDKYLSMEDKRNMALALSVCRATVEGQRDDDSVAINFIGETMAPCIPEELRHKKAQEYIVGLVQGLISGQNSQWFVPIAKVDVPKPRAEGADPSAPVETQELDTATMGKEAAQRLITTFPLALHWLYKCSATPQPKVRTFVKDSILQCIISIALRGLITGRKLSKISKALEAQGSYAPSLNEDHIRTLWALYGQFVTDETAGPLFVAWKAMLPDQVLTVKLILDQALYTGLTQFITVGRAIRAFPTFPWGTVFPQEWSAYIKALQAVRGNPFYGYKKSLGEAASANYKGIAWIARQLLMRSGGNDTLEGCKGFAETIPNQSSIEKMIRAELSKQAEAYEQGLSLSPDWDQVRELVDEYSEMFTNSMGELVMNR